jgi:hypothetical protein
MKAQPRTKLRIGLRDALLWHSILKEARIVVGVMLMAITVARSGVRRDVIQLLIIAPSAKAITPSVSATFIHAGAVVESARLK